MKAAFLILAMLLAGCTDGKESTVNAMTAITDMCKKTKGELVYSFERGSMGGSKVKVTCTTRMGE
ncbi:hypothetical protein [Acidovorax sp.]|uniref:hypothetical protein n=1 Tax=Acidovorax sp. TaxID=1872122 RepID=UPI0031D1B2E6